MTDLAPPMGRPGPPLNLVMVGAGQISSYHLDALTQLEGVRVTAVVARSIESARAVASRYGIADHSTDLSDVLARHDIQAAIVATPDPTHVATADLLLRAGVNTLVQKPIASTFVEASDLLARRRPGTADLSISFMHRFLGETLALRQILREGLLGDIMSVRLRNATAGPNWNDWFFRDTTPTSGVVGQLGVHGIDLVEHLFAPISSVRAIVRQRVPIRVMSDGSSTTSEVPDHVMAAYELSNGVLVSHEMCWAEAGGTDRFRLEVFGTRGTARLRNPTDGVSLIGRDGVRVRYPVPTEPVLGYRHHQSWIDNVVAGHDDGTAADAVRGLMIAEAITAASRDDRTIGVQKEESDVL